MKNKNRRKSGFWHLRPCHIGTEVERLHGMPNFGERFRVITAQLALTMDYETDYTEIKIPWELSGEQPPA